MKPSFRALCFPFVVVLAGLPLSLEAAAQHIPLPPQPKRYMGPGDTVPPCDSPLCQPAPILCDIPCNADFHGYGCTSTCFGNPQGFNAASIFWQDGNGYSIPPECYQVPGNYRVYEITIQDLVVAANAAVGSPYYPRSNLCFVDNCAYGVDSVFTYTTAPFQFHPTGVVTSGGYLAVCGISHGFKLLYENGTCVDLGGRDAQVFNETYATLECTTTLSRMSLQFDLDCLNEILDLYGIYGIYNWDPLANADLDKNTVVFVVIVKCCRSTGSDCE